MKGLKKPEVKPVASWLSLPLSLRPSASEQISCLHSRSDHIVRRRRTKRLKINSALQEEQESLIMQTMQRWVIKPRQAYVFVSSIHLCIGNVSKSDTMMEVCRAFSRGKFVLSYSSCRRFSETSISLCVCETWLTHKHIHDYVHSGKVSRLHAKRYCKQLCWGCGTVSYHSETFCV